VTLVGGVAGGKNVAGVTGLNCLSQHASAASTATSVMPFAAR
jgi:hypothetical protein